MMIGAKEKKNHKHTCQNPQYAGIFLHFAGNCQPIDSNKPDDDTDNESGNIKKQKMISQQSGIDVKGDWYQ